MTTRLPSRWTVQAFTFGVWALAAASVVAWGLRLTAPSQAGVPAAALPKNASADPVAVARLLGGSAQAAAPAAPSLASRFALLGVVADRSRAGVALIAVDGKPAKPFRVGSTVDESLVLQSVEGRRAVLASGAQGPAVLTLELPPLRRP